MHEGHVIKIGGSLFDPAGDIVQDINSSGSPVIVVPGGALLLNYGGMRHQR